MELEECDTPNHSTLTLALQKYSFNKLNLENIEKINKSNEVWVPQFGTCPLNNALIMFKGKTIS